MPARHAVGLWSKGCPKHQQCSTPLILVCYSEANRRYAWNGQWTGGVHEGVEEQADARMEEVTGHGGWNDKIGQLEYVRTFTVSV